MSAPESEPTYTITVIVERDDEPSAKLTAVFSDVPKGTAESPGYAHYSAVECFRRFAMAETRPDPREG